MDNKRKQVAEVEPEIDIDAWLLDFATNTDQVDWNTRSDGRSKIIQIDPAEYVNPLNVGGSSNPAGTKINIVPGSPWTSKHVSCNLSNNMFLSQFWQNLYPQVARTSVAPVQKSQGPYNIVESSNMHLKSGLKSFGSDISESIMPQPQQLQPLLMQIPQQPNYQSSFVMQSNVVPQRNPVVLNKVQNFQQEQWRMDWVGNNASMLQNGLQAAPHNSNAEQSQPLQAFQQDMISSQQTSGFQSLLSSSQGHHCPIDIPRQYHPSPFQKVQTDSLQGSNQMMQTSSLISPTAGSSQRLIGNSPANLARAPSGSTSSTPQMQPQAPQPNSSEWSWSAHAPSGSTSSTPQMQPQAPQANPSEWSWSDHVHHQLQVMKGIYWAEVVRLYKKARELCKKTSNPELAAHYEKSRVLLERIIKFFQMHKADFIKIPQDKICQYMNIITTYLDKVRANSSVAFQRHLQQLHAPNAPSVMHQAPPGMHQTGNLKFYLNQSTLGSSSSVPQSSSQLELPCPRASLLNSSGEVSMKSRESAEALSGSSIPDSSKWPMQQNAISWQQNANIVAYSQSSSRNEMQQIYSRLLGKMAISDTNVQTNHGHAISSPANTLSAYGSALTQSQSMQQRMKQPMGQTNSFHAFGSPTPQLQKVMLLEGQTVTEQKKRCNEVNESMVKHIVGSNFQMPQPNNLTSKHFEHLRQISLSISNQLHAASPQSSQHSFPLPAISPSFIPSPLSPLSSSLVPESPQRLSSTIGLSLFAEGSTKTPGIQSEAAKLVSRSVNTSGTLNMPSVTNTTQSEGDQQTNRSLKRLIDAMGSVSKDSLCASIRDIGSVINMDDMTPGTMCYGGLGSEDDYLMTDVECFLQKPKLCRVETTTDDKMERNISAFPRSLEESDGTDWANYMFPIDTCIINRPYTELKSIVQEEINETNRKLVETVVEMVVNSSEDGVPRQRAEENIIIKFSYTPMGYYENLKQNTACTNVFSEILVMKLLIICNYPNVSPIVLDTKPKPLSNEVKYGYMEVKKRFDLSLRRLSEPMSIREMATTWDVCARQVFTEFAEMIGGGSFSSVYGDGWEQCTI